MKKPGQQNSRNAVTINKSKTTQVTYCVYNEFHMLQNMKIALFMQLLLRLLTYTRKTHELPRVFVCMCGYDSVCVSVCERVCALARVFLIVYEVRWCVRTVRRAKHEWAIKPFKM